VRLATVHPGHLEEKDDQEALGEREYDQSLEKTGGVHGGDDLGIHT